ncbi:hypothetical protein L873DRAFT_1685365 [Choiromyces venosus 120613-1]|uniref:Uncharacterized protein n=1 Tax=Choiromyces venosus 120613-1 TaxID=1336337 RepID=A0A3N4JS73_9PEZI|nr:hypothetical protein L873DRAFT_1685365 [Choiromyces venosus 120613-1]
MLQYKVDSICTWLLLLTLKQIRFFVRIAAIYRKFIVQFSKIALLLLKLIRQSNNKYTEK